MASHCVHKNTQRTDVRRKQRGWLARSHLQPDIAKVSLFKIVSVPAGILFTFNMLPERHSDWQLANHVL